MDVVPECMHYTFAIKSRLQKYTQINLNTLILYILAFRLIIINGNIIFYDISFLKKSSYFTFSTKQIYDDEMYISYPIRL